MCGIVGFLSHRAGLERRATLSAMRARLVHRGPDAEGEFFDDSAGIGLGHQRLSVVDLTEEGRQPMQSPSGRYVLVYNGEIYNTRELRHELETLGQSFRGHSDTEILLAAIETWGCESAISRVAGMFAFALWDRAERRLELWRDRLGIKPLYYSLSKDSFVFASELKALKQYPGFDRTVDPGAVSLFLRHGYIPSPYTIYRGAFKLPPGTRLQLHSDPELLRSELTQATPHARSAASTGLQPVTYWSASELYREGEAQPITAPKSQIVSELEELLSGVVEEHMLSDVPLGAFLSGGIDSSLVVALMQARARSQVRTFSIGFSDRDFDEAPNARAVAEHLGTQHTELYVTPQQALEVIPRLPAIYDEPFGDSSQIPTLLLCELTRKHVTVCLSGDGGDELFAGYSRYFSTRSIWRSVRHVPQAIREPTARLIEQTSMESLRKLGFFGSKVLPPKVSRRLTANNAYRLVEILRARDLDDIYRCQMAHFDGRMNPALRAPEYVTPLAEKRLGPLQDPLRRLMQTDLVTYLPDDILVKVDRASMAVSLEARVPLLDHRVVEYASRVPPALLMNSGTGKHLLKQLLYRHVPSQLVERPKMGFGVPLAKWLRGPLKQWGDDLLAPGRLEREGFLNPRLVSALWRDHQEGRGDQHHGLWNLLMFQAFIECEG